MGTTSRALVDLPVEIVQLIFDILRRESTKEDNPARTCLISPALLQLGRQVLYTKHDVRHPRVRRMCWTPAIVETLSKQPQLAALVKEVHLDLARSHRATAEACSMIIPYLINLQSLSISGFIPSETTSLFEQLLALPPDRLAKITSLSLEFWVEVAPVKLSGDSLIPLLPQLDVESLSLQGADFTGFEFPDGYRLELRRFGWENCELKDEAMMMINSTRDSLESLTLRFDNYSGSTLFSPVTTFTSLHSLPRLTYLSLQDIQTDPTSIHIIWIPAAKSANASLSDRFKELFDACTALRWLKIGLSPRMHPDTSSEVDFHLELLPKSIIHLEFSLEGRRAVAPRALEIVSWLEGGGGGGLRTLIVSGMDGMAELENICSARKINLNGGDVDARSTA